MNPDSRPSDKPAPHKGTVQQQVSQDKAPMLEGTHQPWPQPYSVWWAESKGAPTPTLQAQDSFGPNMPATQPLGVPCINHSKDHPLPPHLAQPCCAAGHAAQRATITKTLSQLRPASQTSVWLQTSSALVHCCAPYSIVLRNVLLPGCWDSQGSFQVAPVRLLL